MRVGYCETCLTHDVGSRHPESPDRLRAIRQRLDRQHGIEFADATPVTVDRVEAVHDPEYVAAVEAFCADGGGRWDADTVGVEATYEAALASAGHARWAAREALAGADGRQIPFAVARPPGHHAVVDDAMGFCFFNNAAVAAQWALDEAGCDRVAIVDWDVHHGNGTQQIFYDRGDVFYASLHEQGLYPGTGAVNETGTDAGAGTTLNLPVRAGTGDPGVLVAIDRAIGPALARFDPDLVLVSAGFDAHERDPISRLRVTTEGYGAMTAAMRTIAADANAGLGFVLEGGYGLDALADSVAMVAETVAGRDPVPDEGTAGEETERVIERARAALDLD